jgi:uncharacterized membrane protein
VGHAGALTGAARDAGAAGEDPFARTDPPVWQVALWPHRSMTPSGFRWFIGLLAAGLCVPMVAAWGTPAAAGLAPFLLAALALAWWMLRLNDRRRARCGETLRLWPDAIAVEHCGQDGRVRRWSANPYWVAVDLRTGRGIENYLTLTGAGRTIELGAFLAPQERVALAAELRAALAAAASGRPPPPGGEIGG